MEDTRKAINNIKEGKAISWDLIPDDIITFARTEDCCLEAIHKIMQMIAQQRRIPYYSTRGRLFVLNKCPSETPTLDNLRPINITSILVKIWEHLIWAKLCVAMKWDK